MTTIALYEAKNRLSELIAKVQLGERFDITRRGKVVATLVPPNHDSTEAASAIARLRVSREGVSLGKLKSRELITSGRRG